MPQGVPLDRPDIHRQMWEARDRSGKVPIHQKKFAAFLGISPTHLSRVIKDFEEQGRLRKVGARYRNVGVYIVRDPVEFDQDKPTGLG